MKYSPDPLLFGSLQELAEYVQREFRKLEDTLTIPEVRQLNYGQEVDNNATSTTLKINWKAGQKQRVDFSNSSSCTLSFVAPEGVCNLMLRLVQDSTGSRAFTFPSTVKWQGGTVPTWSTAANAVDVVAMYYDGTNYHATASLDSK